MDKYYNLLKRTPVFSGMDEDEIRGIVGKCSKGIRHYMPGEYILHSGDVTGSMGILLSAKAIVIKEDAWGNRNIMAKIGTGQIFAESFACASGKELDVSVVAEGECDVLFLNMGEILSEEADVNSAHIRLIRNIIYELANKNLNFNEKLSHMSCRSTKEKVISYLSSVSKKCKSFEFDIPFDRQQLADYLSVERSALSAQLSELKKDGILDYRKNHFVLYMP